MRGAKHVLQILTRSVGVPDAEGRSGATTTATTTVKGRMMFWHGTEDDASQGRYAGEIDVACALPHSTVISPKDQIVASGVSSAFDGTYDVEYVIDTEEHIEAFIRRRVVE